MNPAWLTGKMPKDMYTHEHPEAPRLKTRMFRKRRYEEEQLEDEGGGAGDAGTGAAWAAGPGPGGRPGLRRLVSGNSRPDTLGAPEEKTVNDSNDPTENGYFRNWVSIAGAGLMLASLFGGLLFAAMELLSGTSLAYAGLLYVLCTGFIVLGFLLIPAGALLERRRRKSGRRSRPLTEFHFDLRDREHRLGAVVVIAGAVLVLTLFPVGAYKSFHATESIEFCGQLCHAVMNPEWVRYHDSSHARVDCVECHIGAGAGWFVRSKLSGLRQIWAVTDGQLPPSHPHADSATCAPPARPARSVTGDGNSSATRRSPASISSRTRRTAFTSSGCCSRSGARRRPSCRAPASTTTC